MYEPKTAGGKSEVHQDAGMFSHGRAAKKIVLTQFHAKPLEFVTARTETFWLAEPGKDFELYSQAHLKRVK